jgi:hypothetical protein
MRGLQAGQDVLEVDLDLTLAEPAEAYDHLFGILQRFLTACGFTKHTTIIPERAIKRLVWSSAGVARDFLSLFERAIGHAQAHRRGRVGVEDVNLSVGDLAAPKMRELEEDTSQEGPLIRDALEQLQRVCLNKHKSNSFLIRQEPRALGYQLLQKLVDLRLVHLLHPSVTPRRAGERYEAYLLDYSFYTGVRKRRLLEELTIIPGEPWSHAQRRRLPRIEPDELVTPAERSGDD